VPYERARWTRGGCPMHDDVERQRDLFVCERRGRVDLRPHTAMLDGLRLRRTDER